jgi:transposase
MADGAQDECWPARRASRLQAGLIDKLTHENAVLKRLKFAAKSEKFGLQSAEQKSLLEETLDIWPTWPADAEIEQPLPPTSRGQGREAKAPSASRCRAPAAPRRRRTSPRAPPAPAAAR